MILSKSFLKSAKGEISRLRAQKKVIEAELSHLEALVRSNEGIESAGAVADRGVVLSEATAEVSNNDDELGFKERVLKIVQSDPKGFRPFQVTSVLRDSGFQLPGKTALSMRVAGELARMKRTGRLRKTKGGLYKALEVTN